MPALRCTSSVFQGESEDSIGLFDSVFAIRGVRFQRVIDEVESDRRWEGVCANQWSEDAAKKVDNVLTTLKRHRESDCVLEGAGFVGTCKGRSWSVYFVWEVRILIGGGIERVGASVVKGQQSRQILKVTCVYTSLPHGRESGM
jgi:hypothetical protein